MFANDQPVQLFHEYLEYLINRSTIKQIDIAHEIGYDNPNLITIFKRGRTKVPIEKVPLLAKVFQLDPKTMLIKYLREYDPILLRVIEQHFGVIITKNEQEIVEEIRRLSNGRDPGINSVGSKIAIEVFVGQINAVA